MTILLNSPSTISSHKGQLFSKSPTATTTTTSSDFPIFCVVLRIPLNCKKSTVDTILQQKSDIAQSSED